MKKFLFLAMLLILIPINAYAVSLNTLQTNTSQYIKICETQTATLYLEPNSIKVVRSSHPYHTLQTNVYYVLYDTSSILKVLYTVNYDYNRSFSTLSKRKLYENPNYSKQEIRNYVLTEAEKDSGISVGSKTDCVYDLNGNYLYKSSIPVRSSKADFGTILYTTANIIYYHQTQCKEYFFPPY